MKSLKNVFSFLSTCAVIIALVADTDYLWLTIVLKVFALAALIGAAIYHNKQDKKEEEPLIRIR